jgi:hypothetical protein
MENYLVDTGKPITFASLVAKTAVSTGGAGQQVLRQKTTGWPTSRPFFYTHSILCSPCQPNP